MSQEQDITRRWAGCPYTPADPLVQITAVPWRPATGYGGPEPTACPGYSTRLPEVVEAARAWFHWGKSSLSQFVGGEVANQKLIEGIELMDAAVVELEAAQRDAQKDRP